MIEETEIALTTATRPDLDVVLDLVIPAYNEERVLAEPVRRVDAFLAAGFPYPYCITIADNASTDGTWAQAQDLAAELPRVRALRLEQQG